MAKFPWGDNHMPYGLVGACALISNIAMSIVLMIAGPGGAVDWGSNGSGEVKVTYGMLRGVALLSTVHIINYYATIMTQVISKQILKDGQMIDLSTRCVMNNVENGPWFLVAIWMHALFVNPRTSIFFGWFMVGPRLFYSICYGWYGRFTWLNEIATQPNGAAYAWMYWGLLARLCFDVDLLGWGYGISPYFVPVLGLLTTFAWFALLAVWGGIPARVIMKGVEWDKATTPTEGLGSELA